MKNLVRKTPIRLVCDTYTCNNLSVYEVGHEVNRSFCMHYCEECMKTIVNEASAMLFPEMKMEPQQAEPEPEKEEEPVEVAEEEKKEEEVVEKKQEYYICKYCGERFEKPERLNEYRSHVMKCQRS